MAGLRRWGLVGLVLAVANVLCVPPARAQDANDVARIAAAPDTTPLPREATAPAGAIAATHAVTDGGQAVYSVAIQAPPGLAGLAPALALTATSGQADGLVGEGWSLSGFSTIERCPLNAAQSDGFARPIGDQAGRPDAFCLDGQLLVLVSGTYGGENSAYRTETDSFTRVIASGVDAGGPQGFEVRAKDGTISRYGFSTDAVASVGSVRHRWAVTEEQDRSGNYLEFVYARACLPPTGPGGPAPDCTRYAPSEVRYGGHRSPGGAVQAHDRSIRFTYETRADGWSAFARGLRDLEWRRVSAVETVVAGTVVRRYHLDYDTRTDLSRLTRLRECVDDAGGEVCKPPTTFTYDNGQGYSSAPSENLVVPYLFGNGLGSDAVGRTIVLDVNGDGLDDLVFPAPREHYTCSPALSECDGNWTYRLALATGNRSAPYAISDLGLGSQTSLGFTFWCVSQDSVIDYNGDGRDDLFSNCGPHTIGTVLVSTGVGFTRQTIPVIPPAPAPFDPFWMADLNGDSLSDVLICKQDTLQFYLNRGPGAGFDSGRTLPNFGHDSPSPLRSFNGTAGAEKCEAPMFLDSDGDGVVNALKRRWTIKSSALNHYVWTQTWGALTLNASGAAWVNTGLIFDETIEDTPRQPDDVYDVTPYWAGEIDDTDPLNDEGQVTVTTYARKWQLRVADVNGDGLDDVLRFDGSLANPVRLHTNTGSGFSSGLGAPVLLGDPSWDWYRVSAYSFARAQFVDYNNDGRTDVLLPIGGPRSPAALRWVVQKVQDRSSFTPELIGTMNLAEQALPLRADVDGDGSDDLLLAADVAGLDDAFGNKANRLTVRWGSHARGNLLVTARDGMGESVLFDYSARDADQERVYRRTANCNVAGSWCRNRTGPLVSSTMVRIAERSPVPPFETLRRISFQTFHYENSRHAWYGRGSLGFERRITTSYGETNNNLVETSTREFDNSTHLDPVAGSAIRHLFPYAGRLKFEEVVSGEVQHGLGTPVASQRVLRTGPVRFAVQLSSASVPFVAEQQTASQELMRTVSSGAERQVSRTQTDSAFDSDGNATVTDTVVANGAGAEAQRTRSVTSYERTAARGEQWLLGLPARNVVTESRQGRAQTRTTVYTHTADRGLPLTMTREPDDAAYLLTETTEYDEFGNAVTQTLSAPGEAARITTTGYDPRGLFPQWTRNPEGHLRTMQTDGALGLNLVDVDPNGVVHKNAYDGLGRLTRAQGPAGETVSTYARADTDTSADLRARLRITEKVAGGATTVRLQDGLTRVIETSTSGYAGSTVLTATTYDWADRPLSVARPHVAGDRTQGSTTYAYDALGRVTRQTRPDDDAPDSAAVVTTRYGWPEEAPGASSYSEPVRTAATRAVAVTDPLGRTSITVADRNDAPGALADPTGAVTQIEYGPFGIARRIVAPNGSATVFEADRYGRDVAIASADTGKHTYVWTAFDQLRQHMDPRGLATQYTYDRLGRMTARSDQRGPAAWRYDAPGDNAIGKLVEARSPDGNRSVLTYEPVPATGPNRGLLAARDEVIAGLSHRVGYTYDQYGRTTHLEYPPAAGKSFGVDNGYDGAGKLVTVKDSVSGKPYWSFVKDDQGYRIGIEELGNGVTTTSKFEQLSGRLQSTISALPGVAPVQELAYDYDAAGNVRAMRDTVRPERSRTYGYDPANRLTEVRDATAVAESFGYDASGNMTTQSGVGAYVYGLPDGTLPNAVIKAGDTSYQYDEAGNQRTRTGPSVEGGTQTIAWTPTGLPARVGVGKAGAITTFDYNADEDRVRRSEPGAVTTYLAGLYERRVDTATSDVEHRYYVQAGDRTVAQVVRTESGGKPGATTIAFEHPDRIGSPLDHSDTAGARGESQQFGAYGRNLEPDWRTTGERGFAGHQHDSELGLIDMDGRLFDPKLARFMSADPVLVDVRSQVSAPQQTLVTRATSAGGPGTAQAPAMAAADLLQPYAYAANNPIGFADPSGRDPEPAGVLERAASWFWNSTPGQAISGFAVGVTQGAAPGGFILGPAMTKYAPSRAFEFFRGAGETIVGAVEVLGGGAAAGGGGLLSATGAGAPVGVPLAVGGAAVAVEGAVDVAAGTATMWGALFRSEDEPSAPGGGESTVGSTPAAKPASPAPAAAPGPVNGPYAPPSAVRDAVASRANELQSALKPAQQGRVTMAVGVGKDAAGKTRTVVATSEANGYLRPGVKLNPGEEMAKGAGHAEQNIVKYMEENGITPEWIAAGRPICRGKCLPAIEQSGAKPASPIKEPRKPRGP